MDKDEALKLGLQLVATAEYLATDAEICGKDAKEERGLIQRSKIAFEEALAQPEQESDDLTIAYMAGFYDGKNKDAPQPKPKQEPVVFFRTDNGWRKEEFEKTLVKKVPLDTTPPEPHVWFDFSNVPLDATSPQRTWVGLTDEEKSDLWCKSTGRNCVNEDTHVFADAIEAKLKEKNYASPTGKA